MRREDHNNRILAIIGRLCLVFIAVLALGLLAGIPTLSRAAEEEEELIRTTPVSDFTSGEFITDIEVGQITADVDSTWNSLDCSIGGTDGATIRYRCGGRDSALCDLKVIRSSESSIEVGKHTYRRLTGLPNGAAIYGSTSEKTGSPILSIGLVSEFPYANGLVTARDEDGAPGAVGRDAEGNTCYLTLVHEKQILPYVSDLAIVSGKSETGLRETLLKMGFDYYRNVSTDDDRVQLIGYNRTEDESDAVRGVYLVKTKKGYQLFYSRDEAAGHPVIDVGAAGHTIMWDSGDTFELSTWARRTFLSGDLTDATVYRMQDPDYRQLAKSSEKERWNEVEQYDSLEDLKIRLGYADSVSMEEETTEEPDAGEPEAGETDTVSDIESIPTSIVIAQKDEEVTATGEIRLVGVKEKEMPEGETPEVAQTDEEGVVEETGEEGVVEETGEEGETPEKEEIAEGESEESVRDEIEGTEADKGEESLADFEQGTEETEPTDQEEGFTGSLVDGSNPVVLITSVCVLIALIVVAVIMHFRRKRL